MRKKARKKESNPLDKQAALIVSAIIVFLFAMIATPYIYHQVFEKFSYAGINFEKVKSGKLVFYHGVFPVIYKGTLYTNFNLYLRTDPRQNKIPINTNFSISQNVTISLDPEVIKCKSAILGQSLAGQFFNAFPWVQKVDTASTDREMAVAQNWSYVTCANATKYNTVLVVKNSNFTSIDTGSKDNCFVLNIGNCEYLETMERLVVGVIAQINNKKI